MNTKEKILECYLSSLESIMYKLKRGIISKYQFYDLSYNSFSLYRSVLNNLGLDNTNESLYQVRKPTEEDIEKYKYDVDGFEFPLIHIFTYFGVDYPEYVDDYGMDTFLLVDNQPISTQRDWDYALDKIIFYEKFTNVFDGESYVEDKLEKALKEINDLIRSVSEYEDYYEKD